MSAETRKLCFRTYQNLVDENIAVRVENYDQVYLAAARLDDSAEKIWQRLQDKPPRKFKGYHSISVSDVLVYNKEGVITSYYIDKDRLIVLAGFIRLNSSSALISMETDDFKVEGTKGNWIAADEIIVDGRQFFLLQNDVYKDDVPYNMIDGRMNNISSAKQSKQTGKGRTSVLEKLHRKQKEIAIRSGKQQPEQVMGADMERNRK